MSRRVPGFAIALGIAAVAVALLAAACGGKSSSTSTPAAASGGGSTGTAATAAAGAATDLVAKKVSPASLAPDDAAWKDVPVTVVKTEQIQGTQSTHPVDVSAQALYSDTDIWFRFQWADTSETDTALWAWDGTKWSQLQPTQQDRLALNWLITDIPEFDARGCQGICHREGTDVSKWYMIAPQENELVDNWQWTAATSGPMGQANDLTITGKLTAPDALSSPFVADASSGGGTKSNSVSASATATPGPINMQDPSKPATYGKNYLAIADAVPIDMSKIKVGDTIPRTMLSPYTGSRGDIEAKGTYANGQWTVVLHRKLDTGHPDDIKFTLGQSYPFGLGAFDGLGDENHTVTTTVYTLKLGN